MKDLKKRYRKPKVAYAGREVWYFTRSGRIRAGDTVEVCLFRAQPVPAVFSLKVKADGNVLVVDIPGGGATDLRHLHLRLKYSLRPPRTTIAIP